MVDGVFNRKKEESGAPKTEKTYKRVEGINNSQKERSDCKDIHIIRFNKCMTDTDNNYHMCEEILNLYMECSP